MISAKRLRDRLADQDELKWHPQWSDLVQIATGPTSSTSAGFPYICQSSFVTLIEEVPHLFADGLWLLDWLRDLGSLTERMDDLSSEEVDSLARATKVLQAVVFTAGVTAPPDLWLLRHVLDAHGRLGLLERWRRGETLSPERLARDEGFNESQLRINCHLLRARGYLTLDEGGFRASARPQTPEVLAAWMPLPPAHEAQLVDRLAAFIRGERHERDALHWAEFFSLPAPPAPSAGWVATRHQIEAGHRLVPLVLAFRVAGTSERLVHGAAWSEPPASVLPEIGLLLERAGLIRDGHVTLLGERVFAKGPGPFGIIHAYEPYMLNLAGILRNQVATAQVNRAANVAASQDANRQTFEQANRALDAFRRDTGFRFGVFIEHAVGQGEAIRQRHARDGDALRYFGADLEDASIEAAIAQQRAGLLPAATQWIRRADIGRPEAVIDFVRAQGLPTEGAVMMVGNGFHEIRHQTNERMIEVFRRYEEAGLVLIFTEETALSDTDLLGTAWNTYHAGFRYVHEMSGQGLRPATQDPHDPTRLSWRACAERGGYVRLEKYCSRTRTIFPFPREDGHNPSISVSHFCVPRRIAQALGVG
jgi:hypothetical protein